MRIRLKGINVVRKRLADGSVRAYHYAWKGGPALCGEPGTPEFIASYNDAAARKVTPPRGRSATAPLGQALPFSVRQAKCGSGRLCG